MKIALDAMGGDHAPREMVKGAVAALASFDDVRLTLVGDERAIEECLELDGDGCPRDRLAILHASETVGMDESAVEAVRHKKDSSIRRAARTVADGEADALVSAGNTGAAVAAAILSMRTLKGVRRPGIAANLPTATGCCTAIDVGSNIQCRPEHLAQYGVMAASYVSKVRGIASPRVGLLNIGTEDGKGTRLVMDAHQILKGVDGYVGYVEGRDIFLGGCDVVVCDGFTGNVLLKVTEGIGESVVRVLREKMEQSVMARLGALLCSRALHDLKDRMDYAEYGGAPLLGLDGACMICHGGSEARAIENAVGAAARFIRDNVNADIVEGVAKMTGDRTEKDA